MLITTNINSYSITFVLFRWYSFVCVCVCVCVYSVMSNFFATPWTVAHQASLSMEVFRQEYLSGLPCPPPGGLPNPGIELASSEYQAASLLLSHWGSPIVGGHPHPITLYSHTLRKS